MFENKAKYNNKQLIDISSIKKSSRFFIRGSMTVEASVVLPLFLVFFINFSCSIEMIRLHSNLSMSLWNIGNDLTMYGALITENMRELGRTGHIVEGESAWNDSSEEQSTELSAEESNLGTTIVQELGDLVVSYTYIKNRIVEYLGEDYLNKSPLVEGVDSLQFYESDIFTSNDTVVITTTYQVAPIIDFDDFITMRMSNCYYAHLWNGYNVCGDSGEQSSRIVYVTEDSEVYHVSTACTYLRLSVRISEYANLNNERNNDGGRYYPCFFCARSGNSVYVYLCDEGSKYHYSRNCLALRRNFSIVSLSSVSDTHRPCSRCGGN